MILCSFMITTKVLAVVRIIPQKQAGVFGFFFFFKLLTLCCVIGLMSFRHSHVLHSAVSLNC